jgi:hypothetical protein
MEEKPELEAGLAEGNPNSLLSGFRDDLDETSNVVRFRAVIRVEHKPPLVILVVIKTFQSI